MLSSCYYEITTTAILSRMRNENHQKSMEQNIESKLKGMRKKNSQTTMNCMIPCVCNTYS